MGTRLTIAVTPSCGVICLTLTGAESVHDASGPKGRKEMKLLKQIPMWLTIDALIIFLGLVTLGIVTLGARIYGEPI